ncbi:MAG: hypothetical protein ABI406_17350, partial [Ktedonobacteraceae bacterium]
GWIGVIVVMLVAVAAGATLAQLLLRNAHTAQPETESAADYRVGKYGTVRVGISNCLYRVGRGVCTLIATGDCKDCISIRQAIR